MKTKKIGTPKKSKFAPIVLRTITAGNSESGIIRADLVATGEHTRKIVISKQTSKEVEVKSKENHVSQIKTLFIVPNKSGINMAEVVKRQAQIDKYLKGKSVTEALEEVGKEVIKKKAAAIPKDATDAAKEKIKKANDKLEDTVISWQPKIEKDLKFPVDTAYSNVPVTKEVTVIDIEMEYSYKEIHTNEILYRLKSRDFVKYVHNYLNSKRD